VLNATGTGIFADVLAVRHIDGDPSRWQTYEPFLKALHGNSLILLSLQEMGGHISVGLTNTLAATEVGRMLQLCKSAGIPIKK
jgi:hypothetical protein